MTPHYAQKLQKRHWYDLQDVRRLLKLHGTLSADLLMSEMGWCRTKSVEVLSVSEQLGILKEDKGVPAR